MSFWWCFFLICDSARSGADSWKGRARGHRGTVRLSHDPGAKQPAPGVRTAHQPGTELPSVSNTHFRQERIERVSPL